MTIADKYRCGESDCWDVCETVVNILEELGFPALMGHGDDDKAGQHERIVNILKNEVTITRKDKSA